MRIPKTSLVFFVAFVLLAGACVSQRLVRGARHRWWAGLGPVLPHDSFPADCTICHVGNTWNRLVHDFSFDHKKETGFALNGAHGDAQCLRCHNDRGPVAVFQAKGCAGCHEDVHQGDLGRACATCHNESTWEPTGLIAKHNLTRFPLTGGHALVACHQCHPGATVGNFLPVDTECLTCHTQDLANTANPPHIPLGWVDNCDRCHIPTKWEQATIQQNQRRAR